MGTLYDVHGVEITHQNKQDKQLWYVWGEKVEVDFVRLYGTPLGLKINPNKSTDRRVPDLMYTTSKALADLKAQNTPFFQSLERYGTDPQYTVVFNVKDKLNYEKRHPTVDVYFWVCWLAVRFKDNRGWLKHVKPMYGVWKIPFQSLLIILKHAPTHDYLERRDDIEGNAKASYVLEVTDPRFVRLVGDDRRVITQSTVLSAATPSPASESTHVPDNRYCCFCMNCIEDRRLNNGRGLDSRKNVSLTTN